MFLERYMSLDRSDEIRLMQPSVLAFIGDSVFDLLLGKDWL